jgi:hypothetical protein
VRFLSRHDLSEWRDSLGLRDVLSFVIVAWLHGASCAGAFAGLVLAIVYVRRVRADA